MSSQWRAAGLTASKAGDLQAGEEVLLDVADDVFDAALFVGLAHVAGAGLEAVVGGEVEVAGIEERPAGRRDGCSTPVLRLSIMIRAGTPPKNSKAFRWQARKCSMLSPRVNST